MKRLNWLAVLVLILLVAYTGISWYFSSKVIVYTPQERPQEWYDTYAPAWDVPIAETVEIASGDNTIIADIYDNPEEADCGVVIVHGLGADRIIARLYGPIFYQLGCDILAYDFAPANNDVFLTYGVNESVDLSNILDWFADYLELPKSRIGIWAESYGAATTLIMLPQQPEIAWVVVDSPFASMDSLLLYQAESQFGSAISIFLPGAFFFIEQRANISISDSSPESAIADVEVPVLLIHSLQDEFVPPENSQRIFDASNQEITQLELTDWGAIHAQSIIEDKDAYAEHIYQFIAEFAPEFGNQTEEE